MSLEPFWEHVIAPVIAAFESPAIAKVGSLFDDVTVKLLKLAVDRGGVVDLIDPTPAFGTVAALSRFGPAMRFHRAHSHDTLGGIKPPDVVVIDGDHNWYTVHGELRLLKESARRARRDFPLVMLHDVEWPYGRRDLYSNPDLIPAEHRRPWARHGIVWGQSALGDNGGLNAAGANAIEEGGPGNGVLTAVEDFLAETGGELSLQLIPGFHGLALIASPRMLQERPAVRRQWERLATAEFQAEHARRLAAAAAEGDAIRNVLERRLRELAPRGGASDFALPEHQRHDFTPERCARYGWAESLTAGCDVLDAGCGVGWGTAQLGAQARRVVGVDIAEPLISQAKRTHGDGNDFICADLRELPFEDATFGVAVCFETIERVPEPGAALDELRRVLTPDGLLLISVVNRVSYPAGNPFHLHEFAAGDLEKALQQRFDAVEIHPQHTYVASLLGDVETMDGPCRCLATPPPRTANGATHEALYLVVAASNGDLPPAPAWIALGSGIDPTAQSKLIAAWRERALRAEREATATQVELNQASRHTSQSENDST